jgi:peptide deformylase
VTCRFYDPDGREKEVAAEGLMARVIQHETDHLDGILFIDKARKLKTEKSDAK